ncbi:MAG: hypothetical protein DMG40_00945 [Acidobacteria bacterium]|nr:MAG: hypothetical protein DMG40_00945 [Acidobacteriota bacterium]
MRLTEFENILLSSSPDVVSLSNQILRLLVKPSHGNYYERGFKLMQSTSTTASISLTSPACSPAPPSNLRAVMLSV